MRCAALTIFAICACPAIAETVLATQTIRPRAPIPATSVTLDDVTVAGAADSLDQVIGAEVKTAVYAGRPVLIENLSRAALVERNDIVPARVSIKGLAILTEARSLERGAAGDVIRAMNLVSRKTIMAEVQDDGSLKVVP